MLYLEALTSQFQAQWARAAKLFLILALTDMEAEYLG